MKLSEIEPCIGCGRGVIENGALHWYSLELTQLLADVDAIVGAMSGVLLERDRIPDSVVAIEADQPVRVLVCLDCYLGKTLSQLDDAIAARTLEVPS